MTQHDAHQRIQPEDVLRSIGLELDSDYRIVVGHGCSPAGIPLPGWTVYMLVPHGIDACDHETIRVIRVSRATRAAKALAEAGFEASQRGTVVELA